MGRAPAKEPADRWSVRREVDPISVVALLLSLLAVGSQVVAWAQGPIVRVISPERVYLYAGRSPENTLMIRVAAPISAANVAAQQYAALIVKETAVITVGNLKSRQEWNAFGTPERGASGVVLKTTGNAAPVPLAGQTAVSHLTLFTPLRQRCEPQDRRCNPTANYISPEQFAAALQGARSIWLTFTIEMFDGETLTRSCEVALSPVNRPQLANLQTAMFYGICYPAKV